MNTSTTSVYQSLVSKNFDWADFVNKETKVWYRYFVSWSLARISRVICLRDLQVNVIHICRRYRVCNVPQPSPRVAIAELKLDMPSSEHCFSATTADSCWGALEAENSYRPKGLATLIAKFLGKYWDDA